MGARPGARLTLATAAARVRPARLFCSIRPVAAQLGPHGVHEPSGRRRGVARRALHVAAGVSAVAGGARARLPRRLDDCHHRHRLSSDGGPLSRATARLGARADRCHA